MWLAGAETHYVEVGDADVAYKVVGDGVIDLVYFYGLGSHVDYFFDDPAAAGWIEGLLSFCRLIVFDRRGRARLMPCRAQLHLVGKTGPMPALDGDQALELFEQLKAALLELRRRKDG